MSSDQPLPVHDMATVFLSYARGDDEPFVERLRDDLASRGISVWWDRVSMESRGRTFHQEILDGIDRCQRLLLVVGPQAAISEYVRQEWKHALAADKVVVPILRRGDFSLSPSELSLLHCEDFRYDLRYELALTNLVRLLSAAAPPLGKLIAVPSLPPHYLERPDRLRALRDAVRADLDRPISLEGAASRIGVHGMGGIGKSVLAAAVARDRKVREAFPDGVYWIGFGQAPPVAERMRELHRALGGDGAFASETDGKQALREVLFERQALLVLDDVWKRVDADAFDVLGPRCRALVTTRDAGMLTSLGGSHQVVELLTDAEAMGLIAATAGRPHDELPQEASDVVVECGRLPLAVSLCGSLVRHGRSFGEVLSQLRQARLDRIADRNPVAEQHRSVHHAIHIGVEALDPDLRERFLQLAVFENDELVPSGPIAALWSRTGELDHWGAEDLLLALSQRSLLELTTETANGETRRFIRLHDLIFDYVRVESRDLVALHEQLLDAYWQRCPAGWSSGSDDGYYFARLTHHQLRAGRGEEAGYLLQCLEWLEAKNARGMAFQLPRDFRDVLAAPDLDAGQREILTLLEEALRRDLHFIASHAVDYPQSLFQCLWNSCWWYDAPEAVKHYVEPEGGWSAPPPWETGRPGLHALLESWRSARERAFPGFPWIRTRRPPAIRLGSPLVAVFDGHEGSVNCVVFSPDGRRVASGGDDGALRFWSTDSGECSLRIDVRLVGHEESTGVNAIAFSPDGALVAVAIGGGEVVLCDAESGKELVRLNRMDGSGYCVAYSPDGTQLATGDNSAVRVFDSRSGVQLHRLAFRSSEPDVTDLGGFFRSVRFSRDGSMIAGTAGDAVFVWNAVHGRELFRLSGEEIDSDGTCYRGDDAIFGDFSPDGRKILTISRELICAWDSTTGNEVARREVIPYGVDHAAISSDGERLALNTGGDAIRIFDIRSGRETAYWRANASHIRSLDFSADGRRIVSGSEDGILRVWSVELQSPALDDASEAARAVSAVDDANFATWLAISADGQRLATGSDHEVIVWNIVDGTCVVRFRGDQEYVSCLDYDADKPPYPTCAAISPDGRRIIVGWTDGVRAHDARDGRVIALPGLDGSDASVVRVTYSRNGERLSFVGAWGISIRNADDGAIVATHMFQGYFRLLTISEDERRFVGFAGGDLYAGSLVDDTPVVRVATRPSVDLAGQHSDFDFVAAAISPDGLRVASTDVGVSVWDITTGKRLHRLKDDLIRNRSVHDLAFSGDGTFVITIDLDRIQIWNAVTGECLRTVDGRADATDFAGGGSGSECYILFENRSTSVVRRSDDARIARYRNEFEKLFPHPNGRVWSGVEGRSHAQILELMGDLR